jgi:FKBP-type peptidyl-prolyl cis-trans isomerase
MMHATKLLIIAAGALAVSFPTLAQNGQPPAPVQPPSGTTISVPVGPAPLAKVKATFSDPELEAIANLLSGCRKAELPGHGEIVIAVAPVGITGATDTLYCEVSKAAAMHRPHLQYIWQLTKADGKVRLKTFAFPIKADHLVGTWAAPEAFPPLNITSLKMNMEQELAKSGNGYRGKTLQPFPTTSAGATTMTSEIAFDGETLTPTDRGFDAQGKLVWGPAEGAQGASFKKWDGCPKAQRLDGGLVVIDFSPSQQGETAKPGDRISLDYIGYLENGYMFDSSHQRGTPFTYTKGDKMIEGWNRAMADIRQGMVRRIIIPAELAHGADTNGGKVPPNSTLIYDVVVKGLGGNAAATPGAVTPTLQPVNPADMANDPGFQKAKAAFEAQRAAKLKKMQEDAEKAEKEKADKDKQPAPAPK